MPKNSPATAVAAATAAVLTAVLAPAFLNPASAATATALSDTFTRSVSSAWGAAESGGTWTVRGGATASYSVDGANGVLTLPRGSGLNVDANAVSALNEDSVATVTADKIPSGGGDYFSVVARRQATNEQYAVNLTLSGTPSLQLFRRDATQTQVNISATTVVGRSSFTAGTWWKVRFATTGSNPTTLSAKAWLATAAEPSAWQVTATDSTAALQSAGTPGMGAYLSGSAANGPIAQRVTSFATSVTAPAPGTPTGLVATAGDTRVDLTWGAVAGATAYAVHRNGALVASPTGTSFSDTGLADGTTYSYTVAATSTYGTSTESSAVTATPMPPVPATPIGIGVIARDCGVTVTWNAVSGATSYRVLRGGVLVSSPTGTSFSDAGLANGTSYAYSVAAVNMAGASAASGTVSATPMPPVPAAPSGLSATVGDGTTTLSWSAVAGATGYFVYRDGALLAAPTGTTFADTDLTNGTTYAYTVAAGNMAGRSAVSAGVTATPLPKAPAAPTGLAAAPGDGQATLTWSPTTGATSYVLRRNGTQVGGSITGTSFSDTGLTNGTSYSWTVAAVNLGGASTASTAVSATPAAAGRAAASAGARLTTVYPTPAGAVFVATTGSDATGDGSIGAPLATLSKALTKVTSGGTVVFRGGTYHQGATTIGIAGVTVQNYNGEQVWFDGAAKVASSGFTASGSAWKGAYLTTNFDDSPTYTKGAADSSNPGWRFVNTASYPAAAYPDQVWINGVEQAQVLSLASATTGRFYVDQANHLLYLGTNPSGATVEYSTYAQAFNVNAANVTLRGFGVKRYADSVYMSGVVVFSADHGVLENVLVQNSSTEGVGFLNATNGVMRHVSVLNNGLTGVHGYHSDGLVIDGLDGEYSNNQHFNDAPVSGAVKITRAQNLTVKNSRIANNTGLGLWFDESCYNMTITGNDIIGNSSHGLATEISKLAVVANNTFSSNGQDGYRIDNAGSVTIWNNSFSANATKGGDYHDLGITADNRTYGCSSTGVDTRYCPGGDAKMDWVTRNLDIHNNIYKNGAGNGLVAVEDYSTTKRAASAMNITTDNNEYIRSAASPTWAMIWSSGSANPYVYTTLAAFQSAQGKDTHSVASDNGAALPACGPAALTSAVATLVGQPTGSLHMGAW
jgi:fibronectin type 3 domain-containing protein